MNGTQAVDFQVQVVEWPADDHADGLLGATPLDPGSIRTGRLDDPLDRDSFLLPVEAGQRYRRHGEKQDGAERIAGAKLAAGVL